MKIELRIDRLIVDEALLGDERRHALLRNVQRELQARLAAGDAAPALARSGAIDAPAPATPAASAARASLAARIADAVATRLGLQRSCTHSQR